MKKLSIIVPVYNIGQYLEECIESLIEQTYSDKEIILVDDGSTDNSGKICDTFAGNYNYIKVIHQENKGLPFARNAGLGIAEGEYIGFVDSDDVIKKDMYRKLISALEENDADMAVCNFEVFNKSGIRAVSDRYNTDWIQYSDKNAKQFYSYALDSSCNKIYKHEIIQRNNLLFMDKNIVAQEDFWFLVRYCSHISKIVSLEDSFYKYRDRKTSITKSGIDKDISIRCIRFIDLADEYMNANNRGCHDFLSKMTYEMLFATINQMHDVTPGKIRNAVKRFAETPYYQEMLFYRNENMRSIRKVYDEFKLFLLRCRLHFVFSCFEYIRVRRLHKSVCSEECFE